MVAQRPNGSTSFRINRRLFYLVVGLLGLSNAARGQDPTCGGGTACVYNCPTCCGVDCASCPAQCEVCTSNAAPPAPCCGPNDGCEDFPPISSCCDDPGQPPCDEIPTPLTNLSNPNHRYKGTQPLGLYVDLAASPPIQQVAIPAAHETNAFSQGRRIVPLNAAGTPDWDNGSIVFMSLGHSNPEIEWEEFIEDYVAVQNPDPKLNPKLVFVKGAKGREPLCEWAATPDPDDLSDPWGNILAPQFGTINFGAAVGDTSPSTVSTALQVQVVWMEISHGGTLDFCNVNCAGCSSCFDCAPGLCGPTNCEFPNWVFHSADGEVALLKDVLINLKDLFPNVRQVWLSPRSYGGFSDGCNGVGCDTGNPEPWAYENGFTLQETVRLQIVNPTQLPFGDADDFPLILWGPYIWANGDEPNPSNTYPFTTSLNGLTYRCWDYCKDGKHPSGDGVACNQESGSSKIARMLFEFFSNDPIANQWFSPRPTIKTFSPPNGSIDRRQDFDQATGLIEQGTKVITLTFSTEVRKVGGGSVDGCTSCFSVTSTCQQASPPCQIADLPVVIDVDQDAIDPKKFTITLDRQIKPGHWTTLQALVEHGTTPFLAIRRDPWDRIDLGFLPGDATADNTTNGGDVQRIVDVINGLEDPVLVLHDQNRTLSLPIDNQDRLREIDLLLGRNTTRIWNGYSLPARP